MKIKAIKMSILALGLAASVSGFAATQGVAGATSTGSFTNTLGSVTATQVRVFGLQDSTLTAQSGGIPNGWDSGPAVRNPFCVAHSSGGSVRLSFSSNGISNSDSAIASQLMAVNSSSGAKAYYHMSVYPSARGAEQGDVIVRGSKTTFDIANAQSDLTNCVTPNVQKHIWLPGGNPFDPANPNVYTDVVTVVASPI